MKKTKAYICSYDTLEIRFGATDVIMYPSLKSLKENKPCWKACGILEIDLDKCKVVKKGKGNLKRK